VAKKPSNPETPAERFHKAATDLVRFHERQTKKVKLSAADSKRQLALKSAFSNVSAALRAQDTTGTSLPVEITDFFGRVSAGLVNAQRNLDDQSREYLKTVATQPYALPSIFRIPKVSAEMKFAVDTTQTKGITFLFYKDQTTAEQLHQQTVQFDIVAAPPPPDLIAPPALASIVRLKSDRQGIFKVTGTLPAAVLSDFDRVIVLEIIDTLQNALPNTATRQYLLSFADAARNLGLWWLQIVTSTGAATLAAVLKFGAPDSSLGSLQQFIAAAGDHQKEFLAKLP
jgi:hypothetical protein